jgi:hypothetical protein
MFAVEVSKVFWKEKCLLRSCGESTKELVLSKRFRRTNARVVGLHLPDSLAAPRPDPSLAGTDSDLLQGSVTMQLLKDTILLVASIQQPVQIVDFGTHYPLTIAAVSAGMARSSRRLAVPAMTISLLLFVLFMVSPAGKFNHWPSVPSYSPKHSLCKTP